MKFKRPNSMRLVSDWRRIHATAGTSDDCIWGPYMATKLRLSQSYPRLPSCAVRRLCSCADMVLSLATNIHLGEGTQRRAHGWKGAIKIPVCKMKNAPRWVLHQWRKAGGGGSHLRDSGVYHTHPLPQIKTILSSFLYYYIEGIFLIHTGMCPFQPRRG